MLKFSIVPITDSGRIRKVVIAEAARLAKRIPPPSHWFQIGILSPITPSPVPLSMEQAMAPIMLFSKFPLMEINRVAAVRTM